MVNGVIDGVVGVGGVAPRGVVEGVVDIVERNKKLTMAGNQ